jgi:hypothetical protein
MDWRMFLSLCALLTIPLSSTAWAGSGGPLTYTILGLIIVIILMLAAMWRKIK